MLRNLLFLAALLITTASYSQTVTGSWYGKADVLLAGSTNNYLTELVIKQKGNEVEGIFAYYFKDSYQSFFVRGTFDKKTRRVVIPNLPILFHGSTTRNGIECPMEFQGVLMVSQMGSSMRGSFYVDAKYRYTCPELRVNYVMDQSQKNQDSILRNTAQGQKMWKPQEEDFVITTPTGSTVKTVTADVTTGPNTGMIPMKDPVDNRLLQQFNSRKKTYSRDLLVESDSIRISFYDNGEIDGDSISVFMNNQPVLTKQKLDSRALNLYLTLDSTLDANEISMFAENLGIYPPNTALMVVSDGVNRYEVYISSSLTQNASIRLRRRK